MKRIPDIIIEPKKHKYKGNINDNIIPISDIITKKTKHKIKNNIISMIKG